MDSIIHIWFYYILFLIHVWFYYKLEYIYTIKSLICFKENR